MTKLGYAPESVLFYLRDGWELYSRPGRTWLNAPRTTHTEKVNPRTLKLLARGGYIERDLLHKGGGIVTRWKLAQR